MWLLLTLACGGPSRPPPETAPATAESRSGEGKALATVASFAGIADDSERSRALFGEMFKVFSHPRCSNCHPPDDTPRQGLVQRPHEPPVVRGPEDAGVVGLNCSGCHQEHNLDHARIPGAPHWKLAPLEMAWLGRDAAAICAQITDPARNGGKSLEELHEHLAVDALVGWAWNPGWGREPAPGSQAELGHLARAWIDTGAVCPEAP